MSAGGKLALDMVSDVVCPWCWLGLARLRAALASLEPHERDRVEVRFRPYELDPDVPAGGLDYRAYMAAKFGGSEATRARANAMRDALETAGREEGVPFDFEGISIRPNTLDAHRLLRWAQGQGLGLAMKEALFAAYFRDHRDVGNRNVLSAIGAEVGLHADVVSSLLEGDADADTVRQEAAHYRRLGVSGVPTFIAQSRYALQGAQEADVLVEFLRDRLASLTA
jgi:predicted DsbA family dithiol-disulfide isomerase